MHELSLAISMVEIAEEEAGKYGSPVTAVHLRIGPLAGVVTDALLSSWEVACRNTSLAGSRLVIEEAPLVVYCPKCREDRTIASPQQLKCNVCGAPTPKVVGGRELQMTGLEIDDE